MSDNDGYGRGLVRLFRISVVVAVLASLGPMAFGRPFAWHLGFIVLLLASLCAIVFGGRRSREQGRDSEADRAETAMGHVEIRSGALWIGDGSRLRLRVRLERLIPGRWDVRRVVERSGDSEVLVELVLARAAGGDESRDERIEVVVDSGQIVILDAAEEPALSVQGARIVEAARAAAARAGEPRDVLVLRDSAGLPRGIAVDPPYGDGTYEIRVRQSVNAVEVRLSL